MQTRVQRVLYPRPSHPQDGWLSLVERQLADLRHAGVMQLVGSYRSERRLPGDVRRDWVDDAAWQVVFLPPPAEVLWAPIEHLARTSDGLEPVLYAFRER